MNILFGTGDNEEGVCVGAMLENTDQRTDNYLKQIIRNGPLH